MILTFGVFIILTIIFIAYQIRFIGSILHPPFKIPIHEMIIEKAYKAVDYRANFEYTTLESIQRNRVPFNYFSTERVVRDEGHLNHIVTEFTHDLAKQMVNDGIVEVVDQENMDNPDRHRVQIRVKVYKPEL